MVDSYGAAQFARGFRMMLALGTAVGGLYTAQAVAQTTPASPQDEGQGRSTGLSDVVVTARKVAENQQNVPVAITAFSGDTLQKQNAVTFKDVANFTPGFVMRESPNNSSAVALALRGQFQNDSLATLDPSVGVYVDGVYWARQYGLNADLLDVQSVQVLKGPQGTLFGRNTTGGAMLIQTNDPKMDEISGMVQGSYGRFNERVGTAVLNLGLSDKFAVRGAIQINKRDGYITDRASGQEYGNRDNLTGRVKAKFEPTDGISLVVSGEWFRFDQDTARFITYAAPSALARFPGLTNEIQANLTNVDTTIVSAAPYRSDPVPYQSVRTYTYNATLAVDTPFGQAKLIGGYRRVRGANALDLDGGSAPIALTTLDQNLRQWSVEGQLTGKLFNDAVDFASGITFLHEDGYDRSYSYSDTQSIPAPRIATRFVGLVDSDAVGFYTQATWHVTPRLGITGGIRYSIDDKRVNTRSAAVLVANLAPIACITAGTTPAIDCDKHRADTFSNVSYTVGVDYKLTDDVMFYAKQSRGFRAGGEQLRAAGVVSLPFKPEIVNEQEIGLKSEFLDRRVRLNLSAYHNTLNNAQRSVITSIGGVVQTIVENANARNYGAEAELNAEIARGLVLSGTYSYNDPKYTKYLGVAGATTGVDKAALGVRFDGLAKNQFTLGADYHTKLASSSLGLNVNYNWVGSYATAPDSVGTLAYAGYSAAEAAKVVAATTKPGAGFLNARATIGFADDRFELAVWGRNIFDKRVIVHALFVQEYVSALRNDPATYGVTGTVRF
ncbi:TonB-dependent receptor [Sphingomonas sp. CL5.1]|uniref:TonB-dependent receptor n=1 Tax=Sphingomonas sp. CL5.1 TaxID=2653203 RepID=UPI0015833627|nr:TonB-dependent receptor [Sphingomonas sp. CL5.1]QKS00293.1 TonB-dependent receptor [Sphingomonas sp. CL5.1]